MSKLSKKQKLNFILEKVKEFEISGYEIGKKTGMSISGIERILNGTVKNPHENTLNAIIDYLENKVLGIETDKISEPAEMYKTDIFDVKKYISCMETESKLRKEVQRLQSILRKNNVEFDDNFES